MKINWRTVSEILSENLMKGILGGSGLTCTGGETSHTCQCTCGVGVWQICATDSDHAEQKSRDRDWCDGCYKCS